jgi:hypothetical protein
MLIIFPFMKSSRSNAKHHRASSTFHSCHYEGELVSLQSIPTRATNKNLCFSILNGRFSTRLCPYPPLVPGGQRIERRERQNLGNIIMNIINMRTIPCHYCINELPFVRLPDEMSQPPPPFTSARWIILIKRQTA